MTFTRAVRSTLDKENLRTRVQNQHLDLNRSLVSQSQMENYYALAVQKAAHQSLHLDLQQPDLYRSQRLKSHLARNLVRLSQGHLTQNLCKLG